MGMSIKIHPVIVSSNQIKESGQIPICSKLICDKTTYSIVPEQGGTLKDLQNILKKLFDKKKTDSNGQIDFELDEKIDELVSNTLDELIKDYDLLDKYKKVVICCPLHYIRSESYVTGENKITKLIYQIDIEKLPGHQELRKFYSSHLDFNKQKSKNIQIYEDIKSVAVQWVEHMVKLFMAGIPNQTSRKLRDEGTY